jgi:hypothetical protein
MVNPTPKKVNTINNRCSIFSSYKNQCGRKENDAHERNYTYHKHALFIRVKCHLYLWR